MPRVSVDMEGLRKGVLRKDSRFLAWATDREMMPLPRRAVLM